MNLGDIVVCGVSADIVVEDIGLNVPKGVAVSVPGDQAHRSKELWRYLSQGILFRLDVTNIIRSGSAMREMKSPGTVGAKAPDVSDLEKQLAEAKANQASLEVYLGRLQAENAKLRTEVKELQIREQNAQEVLVRKVDSVLTLLQKMSVTSPLVSVAPKAADSVDCDVPMYIPSQIKPEAEMSQPLVPEQGQSDSGSVSGASEALRTVRKRGR